MPIADLILARIVDAGYAVELGRPAEGDPHFYFVSATERGTGRKWTCSGVTMTDAAAGLAEQLGINMLDEMLQDTIKSEELRNSDALAGKISGISAGIVVKMLMGMGVIFLIDLATPGVNVGVLYVIPPCIAIWSGVKRAGLIALTAVMMAMVLVDALLGKLSLMADVQQEPGAAWNRLIAMTAIGGSAAVMLLLRERARAGWIESRGKLGALLRSLKKEWVIAVVAAGLIALTFGMDIVTPVWADVGLLYLIPLGLMAPAAGRMKWMAAGLAVGLVLLGYMASPRDGIGQHDAKLVLESRWVTAVGLAVMVGVVEILRRWKRWSAVGEY